MPIGKNSIKRVAASGAKPQKTEEAVVIAEKPTATEKKTAVQAAKAPRKTAAKPAAKAPLATKAAAKSQKAPTEKGQAANAAAQKRCGSCYINIGGELPIYLL